MKKPACSGSSVRRWVDKECPKDWCRGLERQEHEYPLELWDKLTDGGFHGIGIAEEYGGQGGDVVMQSRVRARARAHARRAWRGSGESPSFAGGKSIGLYGTERAEGALPAGDGPGRAALLRSVSPSRAAAPTCSAR